MSWTYLEDGPPPADDTLYRIALKALHNDDTRIGDKYFTGKQIRKGLGPISRRHWEIYAYELYKEDAPPPLKTK